VDQLRVQKVQFRSEQDGPIEQELKRRIIVSIQPMMSVQAAYLVRVSYDDSLQQKVALCLKGITEQPQDIARQIGGIFHQMFNAAESLDILFLDPNQEREIDLVARAFFNRRAEWRSA
jgi:hypothetical protein